MDKYIIKSESVMSDFEKEWLQEHPLNEYDMWRAQHDFDFYLEKFKWPCDTYKFLMLHWVLEHHIPFDKDLNKRQIKQYLFLQDFHRFAVHTAWLRNEEFYILQEYKKLKKIARKIGCTRLLEKHFQLKYNLVCQRWDLITFKKYR